jgi:SpoVK/Ycf46/Vps4 family AAA+-type ATPase
MKSELLKRLFRAIALDDQEAIDKLTHLVIEDERKKGHTLLANQLENISKKNQTDNSVKKNGNSNGLSLQKYSQDKIDEYEPYSGLLVAATNLNKSLDNALWRRFDDAIEIPLPGKKELESIVRQTLSTIVVGSINWQLIIQQMEGFSAAQAVRVAQDAAKRAILDREELVIQEHLEEAIEEIKVS